MLKSADMFARLFGFALLLLTLLVNGYAKDKPDARAAQELAAASALTDLSSFPHRVEAKVDILFMKELHGTYREYWKDEQHWRREVEIPGALSWTQVRIGNEMWTHSSAGFTPPRINELLHLMSLSRAHGDLEGTPVSIKGKTIRGAMADCIHVRTRVAADSKSPGWTDSACIDHQSHQLLSFTNGNIGTESNFTDYKQYPNAQFPTVLWTQQHKVMTARLRVEAILPLGEDEKNIAPLAADEERETCDHPKPPLGKSTLDPPYTAEARAKGIQGDVEMALTVGLDGTVTAAHVTQSLDPGLDNEALKAVKRWKFEPATCEGKPVPFDISVEVFFRLR